MAQDSNGDDMANALNEIQKKLKNVVNEVAAKDSAINRDVIVGGNDISQANGDYILGKIKGPIARLFD